MNYGYIRVSTDKQTLENQRFEIQKYCYENNITIDYWIEETISSTKPLTKRKLGKLLKNIKKDDLIITSEISRIGRNLLQVMSILNNLLSIGAKILTIKDRFKLGDDISSKILAFAFGLSAEIERKLISQRTKEALSRLKAEGKILGRPKGRKSSKLKLDSKSKLITKLLQENNSKSAIARKLHVNRITLAKFIKDKINNINI